MRSEDTHGQPEKVNGSGVPLPCIVLAWDQDAQSVRVQMDPAQFKTWEFVLAVLEMAKSWATFQQRNGQAVAMQQAMAEQARLQDIQKTLRGGLR